MTDHLGSPRLVINTADGTIAQRLDYDEFGRVLLDTNPGFQPFGFAGGLYDRDTGLVRFGARDYDAFTGRWTSKDRSGFAGGENFFQYASGDPVNLIDPLGLFPMPAGAVACGAGGGISLPYPQPGSGDPAAVRHAFESSGRGMSGMCGQAAPREEDVSGGVDENTMMPWILPTGDPVVDYARCIHETQHILDVLAFQGVDIPVQAFQALTEYRAYEAQQAFLFPYGVP